MRQGRTELDVETTRLRVSIATELIRCGAFVGCFAFEPVGTLLVLAVYFHMRAAARR